MLHTTNGTPQYQTALHSEWVRTNAKANAPLIAIWIDTQQPASAKQDFRKSAGWHGLRISND